MKKYYALTRTDGSVRIFESVPHAVRIDGIVELARYSKGTLLVVRDAAWVPVSEFPNAELIYFTPAQIQAKLKPASLREIALSDCPTDRVFRNAWKDDGAKIEIDMPKARELWRDRMREVRTPKFAPLDAAYLRADEIRDAAEKQRIAGLKKTLRDVTADPAIEAATTPEQLKAVLPECLK